MYEAFYGLREKPFNLTPDPKYLYLSDKHKEAFAHLLFGIKNRSGFVMVTGEIGTGKTTICRTLLNQLDESTEVAFIFNPCLSPEELLRKINEDFGIKTRATTVRGLIDELNAYLLESNAKGKNCVLVIDEAQNLTPGVLEQIRLLSNLETETQKLLQIVLIGQPELMQHLSLDELRQLNQRITARYHLKALDRNETHEYISYRLRVAGGRRRINFSPSAIKAIFKLSQGTPRVINALSDRALLIGYTKETRDISTDIIRLAYKEIKGEAPRPKWKPGFRQLLPNTTVIATVILLLFGGKYIVDTLSNNRNGDSAPTVEAGANDTQSTTPSGVEVLPANLIVDTPSAIEAPVQIETPVSDTTTMDHTLAGLVDGLDPVKSRNAAAVAMLRAWNLALLTAYPQDDNVESFVNFARSSRLTCEVMNVTLEQIEAINLPAILKLQGGKQAVWVALLGIELDEFRITNGEKESVLVAREHIMQCYANESLIFWRDPAPNSLMLKEGMSGEDVQVLQVQLRALGRLKQKPNGIYSKATVEAIQRIQTQSGLNPDGSVGRQTRMVLYSWLPGFANPELRSMPPLLLGYDDEEPAHKKPKPAPAPEPVKAEDNASAPDAAKVAANTSPAPVTPDIAPPVEMPAGENAPPAAPAPNGHAEVKTDELAPPGAITYHVKGDAPVASVAGAPPADAATVETPAVPPATETPAPATGATE